MKDMHVALEQLFENATRNRYESKMDVNRKTLRRKLAN
jgi:hypothetical protein